MTTTTTLPSSLPRLPLRTPTSDRTAPAPTCPPSGGWAAPTPEVLRSLEAALARWTV